ncbi:carbamoyltransferase [Chitinophaga solisilvae]|uniref:carbamoyltransferase family protein n=1 Tax=Chitinophaga solisilvae TaxID=1233460 RepID=UPI0019226998|nr:carbamoyltransferase C-terminal domain-containing protein [Chitinophaga solisilvae]
MKTFNILAINFNHDGSAVILSDGRISAFLNTERFSKKKKHPGIREADLNQLLKQAGLQLEDISLMILCNIHSMDSDDIPKLYGSSLKESWFDFWVNQTLDKVWINGLELPCLVNPDHHLLHCSLAYYTSPFDSAVCFSWDPTGFGVFIGKDNKMTKVRYDIKTHFTCWWYNEVASQLFDTGIIGAGKVMGLAPYGHPGSLQNKRLEDFADMEEFFALSDNGGNPVMVEANGRQLNATLAYNVQALMEQQLGDIMNDLCKIAADNGVAANICLSGGGALNSVANQVAFRNSAFERIHLHPACGDDGTPIGAAMWYWFNQQDHPRIKYTNRDMMYSVTSYEDKIEQALSLPEYEGRIRVERTTDYIRQTAKHLADDKIIAWFQDGSEIGPRALGNRSILANPRNTDMKDILNSKVKFREGFRPFAPSVLNEFAAEWFGLSDSPFMLRVCDVLQDSIPAVSHVDKTARIQTVCEKDNPDYYTLISNFHSITGIPLVINTSFNIKGESIVETPQDAIHCLLNTQIDYLIFRNFIVSKCA